MNTGILAFVNLALGIWAWAICRTETHCYKQPEAIQEMIISSVTLFICLVHVFLDREYICSMCNDDTNQVQIYTNDISDQIKSITDT